VRSTSAQPVPQIVVRPGDTGPGVAVAGPLREDMGSLDGVEVEARGVAQANQPPTPPRAVNVTSYRVVSVDGLVAHDGTLSRRNDGMWVIGARDTVQLAEPVPGALAALVGRRVYVAGPIQNGRVAVQAFGAVGKPR